MATELTAIEKDVLKQCADYFRTMLVWDKHKKRFEDPEEFAPWMSVEEMTAINSAIEKLAED